jgi:twitching motility protein PilT
VGEGLVLIGEDEVAELSDIHVFPAEPLKSLAFEEAPAGRPQDKPGPRVINEGDELELAKEIAEKVRDNERDDFMVEARGSFWRGRRSPAVDGVWLRMRRMAEKAPTLDTLPLPLPSGVKKGLLHPALKSGGFVHVCGSAGSGKTTSAAATLVSRLMQSGGMATTIEDPPELPLNGFHGKGYCAQTWVKGDGTADWIESMRAALRGQPAGLHSMLFVGEVRDSETAQAMVRAASNGFLVISTGFGNDVVTGIDTFFQLLGARYAGTLAGVLRGVLYQQLRDGRFTAEMLVSEDGGSPVASLIRRGALAQLENELQYQRNRMAGGQDLWQAK